MNVIKDTWEKYYRVKSGHVKVHTWVLISYNSQIFQNGVALSKQERIPFALGRLFRPSNQHDSMVSHSSLLNPRCVASSGFFGRTPSIIAFMTRIFD